MAKKYEGSRNIRFKDMDNNNFPANLSLDTSVAGIKKLVENNLAHPIAHQTLLLNGAIMNDSQQLGDYDAREGSTIVVFVNDPNRKIALTNKRVIDGQTIAVDAPTPSSTTAPKKQAATPFPAPAPAPAQAPAQQAPAPAQRGGFGGFGFGGGGFGGGAGRGGGAGAGRGGGGFGGGGVALGGGGIGRGAGGGIGGGGGGDDDDEEVEIPADAAPARPDANTINQRVAQLQEMGFAEEQSRNALQNSDGTIQGAVEVIINQILEAELQGGGNAPRRQVNAQALTAEDNGKLARIIEFTGVARQAAIDMYIACEGNVENTINVLLGL